MMLSPVRAAAVLLCLLGVADVARAYLPAGVPIWQTCLVAGFIVAADAVSSRRGASRGDRAAVATLLVLLAFIYVKHSRSLDADGVHYFAYLRSLMADRDLDLANDYVHLGAEMTGPNVLPIGAPLTWGIVVAPIFWLSRIFGGATVTGTEPAFVALACFVTIALGACGLLALYRELHAYASPLAACLACVVVLWGSPLRFYLRVLPSFAHGIEFCAAVAVLVTTRKLAEAEPASGRSAFAAGLACGWVFLVRSQDGLLLVCPAVALVSRWLSDRRNTSLVRDGAFVLAGFSALAWIQCATWRVMFGQFILIPHKAIHGDAFLPGAGPRWLDVLLSDRGGLIPSYPALGLALLGLLFFAPRRPSFAIASFVGFVLMWRVNASIFDWWQVRRFMGLVPFLSFGLIPWTARLSRAGLLISAVTATAFLQYDLALDTVRTNPGESAPVSIVLREATDATVEMAYECIESVAPRVAVALLRGYTGESLLTEAVSVMNLAEARALRLPTRAKGLSAPEAEDGRLARWAGPEARIFLALAGTGGELRLSFDVRSIETERPQTVRVSMNDRPLGETEVPPTWTTLRFIVPESVWREGTNEIVLSFGRNPIFRQVRGQGPREPRSAAISQITIHTDPRR